MNVKLILPALLVAVLSGAVYLNYKSLAGQGMAWLEAARLRATGAEPDWENPAPQDDRFLGESLDELAPVWALEVMNGGGKPSPFPLSGREETPVQTRYHVTELSLKDGLEIIQHFDHDYEAERGPGPYPYSPDNARQYNNATLVGFRGYQPTPAEDILLECELYVHPDFYGSSGCIFEPVGTLQDDGQFKDGRFSFFGLSLMGPGSTIHGTRGATAVLALNWWPAKVLPLPDVDIKQPHLYSVRLHWVDKKTWLGTLLVDGVQLAETEMPPLGPVEVQLWSDNYVVTSNNPHKAPAIAYGNGEYQSTHFSRVAVRTEAR